MRSLCRPTHSTIHYHGREDERPRHSVTFSINGVRWEYTLTAQNADTVEFLARKVTVGKAFAFAKQSATGSRKLDLDPRTATLLRHRGGIASRSKRVKPGMPNV